MVADFARHRLKAIGQRENRWMQDVNHCISKALVENNPKHTLFVLEDLTESSIRYSYDRVNFIVKGVVNHPMM